ncbi:MAG: DNA helicase II / ATP-dependent DNA helicase PcrA [Elusimicrobia bacterium]|nr:MAG: DNA helicase II / ATP-dependent DNA helicase PcrA [Elusimicrobiota bacterium]
MAPGGLNPQQDEAAGYRGGPLLILAGAGTGKTRVIVHRIASLINEGTEPGKILAVTFTNKAAQEMRHRVDALIPGAGARVWVHTFHAFAAKLLRRHAAAAKLPSHFTVYDSTDSKRVVVEAMHECGLSDEKNKSGLYVSVISRAKDDLLDPQSYAIYAMAQGDPFRQNVAKVYERYQKKLDASGGVDFGDLLLKVCLLMKEDADLRDRYQKAFEHVLVDEYQDTNHAQYVLTKTLSAQHRNLCVVGDADQSIYAFRGANIRNILEFETDFKDAKVVKLEENYRSTPEILAAATAVIANNRRRHDKALWTKNEAGTAVTVEEAPDERAEARWVVRRVVELAQEKVSYKDIAVFYRTNAQSRQFEEAFSAASLPFKVVGSVRFYERKEIKDALAYARSALNPSDSVSLDRVLNVPTRGVGKSAEDALKLFATERELTLRQAVAQSAQAPGVSPMARRGLAELDHVLNLLERDINTMTPSEAMNAVLQRTGYWSSIEAQLDTDPEAASRLGNLQELLNALAEFGQRGTAAEPARLSTFLEEVALQSGADGYDAAAPAVTFMTVHLAKGLEFPAVFVTGMEEGLFPIAAGNYSAEDLEEERRLCYVAMTRAKERLFLVHAATRRLFGRVSSNLPSRFILEARVAGRASLEAGDGSGDDMPPDDGAQTPHRSAFEPVSPSAPPPLTRLKNGMRVRHPEFGVGRVTDTSGSGEGMRVTVHFENGSSRRLLVRYAPLLPA